MQQMIATATAVAGCSRPDTQTVTITPLPTVPISADPTSPPPPPQPTASATLGNQPPPAPPPPDPSGYLVVDMLPAPARCLGVAGASKASGKFRRDGGMVLDLTVTLPQSGAAKSTFNASTPSAWPGTLVSSSFNSSKTVANVRLRPGPASSGSASAGVQLSITCGGGGGTLEVVASFPASPTESTTPTISMHDY